MSLDHLSLLAADIDAFAAAVEHGPLDAPIAGCPGWDLAGLAAHLGGVHRWATLALVTAAVPQVDPASDPVPGDAAALGEWIRRGGATLLTTLRTTAPDAPTWHPFPVSPKVAGLWRRRQAQETSVHRWDAESAIGVQPVIDAPFAADGIDEYWRVMLPRLVVREHRSLPTSPFAVVATDTGDRWVVDGHEGAVRVLPTDAVAAAELHGDASSLLLRLWGRPVDDDVLEHRGDPVVAASWLDLGGA
jgi:uncharacterized protein (TIGR03083 family)